MANTDSSGAGAESGVHNSNTRALLSMLGMGSTGTGQPSPATSLRAPPGITPSASPPHSDAPSKQPTTPQHFAPAADSSSGDGQQQGKLILDFLRSKGSGTPGAEAGAGSRNTAKETALRNMLFSGGGRSLTSSMDHEHADSDGGSDRRGSGNKHSKRKSAKGGDMDHGEVGHHGPAPHTPVRGEDRRSSGSTSHHHHHQRHQQQQTWQQQQWQQPQPWQQQQQHGGQQGDRRGSHGGGGGIGGSQGGRRSSRGDRGERDAAGRQRSDSLPATNSSTLITATSTTITTTTTTNVTPVKKTAYAWSSFQRSPDPRTIPLPPDVFNGPSTLLSLDGEEEGPSPAVAADGVQPQQQQGSSHGAVMSGGSGAGHQQQQQVAATSLLLLLQQSQQQQSSSTAASPSPSTPPSSSSASSTTTPPPPSSAHQAATPSSATLTKGLKDLLKIT